METIRRDIHPEVRIVDRAKGIVDYVASDETIDSYKEIIRANGWRFSQFRKNSPFVDSHDYSTIGKQVGRVIDFRVSRGKLINTVRWAIDVPENELAQLGWKMTEAGYLKAVSVGFWPLKSITSADREEWARQIEELGLSESERPPIRIYTQQEQIELSACILGANPNALLEAHKCGVLSDQDIETFQKRSGNPRIFQIPFAANPQPSEESIMTGRQRILEAFDRTSAQTKSSFDALRRARLSDAPDRELVGALRQALQALRREELLSFGDPIQEAARVPEVNLFFNSISRALTNAKTNPEQWAYLRSLLEAQGRTVVSQDAGVGAAFVPETVAPQIHNLLALHGAWATLGAQPLRGKQGKFPVVTAYPNAAFLTVQGSQIPEDATMAGTSVMADTLEIACLINCARALDEDTDLAPFLLENLVQALNNRLDTGCFIGTGVADADNGGITGLFVDATISTVSAGAGNTTVEKLDGEDFLRVLDAVAADTFSHPCRWWIATGLLPKLLRLRDSSGKLLLSLPPESPGFYLLGFPIRFVPVAPATNDAGNKVALFGDGRGFAVGLRNWFQFTEAGLGYKFDYLLRGFRAVGRANGQLAKATAFATLTLAAA